jgi:hypothetical protein
MVGRDWLTRAHNLLGFKTDDGRREDALRHFIALVYLICTVLLLDYSDQTQDACPNSRCQVGAAENMGSGNTSDPYGGILAGSTQRQTRIVPVIVTVASLSNILLNDTTLCHPLDWALSIMPIIPPPLY